MTSTLLSPRGAHRRGLVLIVLCFVQFMLILDDNVVSVALPSIRDDLGFSSAGLAWVVNAYFLSFGGLLLLFGRMADLLGRRRSFLLGVTIFGAASLLCGLAQEPWQLVLGRIIQGAGSAMASPAALSLITLLYPSTQERAKALGIWGGIAGLGSTFGLVISGALTGLASWRWIFFINLPVALVALVLLPRLIGESRASKTTRLDVPGAVLGTLSVVALVYGLLQAGESGWHDGTSYGSLILAVVLAVVFVLTESRTEDPLVSLEFVSNRTRAVANVSTLIFSAALFAMAFLLMIHLQTVVGYGPLKAGFAYMPFCVALLAGMWFSSRVVMKFGFRQSLVVSFLITAVGFVMMSGIEAGDDYVTGILPSMLVTSLGCGLSLPVLSIAAVSGTTGENAGLGSALFSSVQQIGGASGVAVLVMLATRRTDSPAESDGPVRAATAGFSFGMMVAAGFIAVGAVFVGTLLGKVPTGSDEPQPDTHETARP
ncbi:drug resistance transporter, EmrB/QacA subfamily [Streptomyces sp. MnatMP-M77]|uniref:DHA2 family efflux MFS transporter permease subunit n=1 Tax=unclassified Streptomyces TaxID=2593676 RepID=UPI000805A1FF|nr:MFS transporter [Streptomyces sp. MnatMP-M77]SBU91674.1 drug resistance transporter, EmrB/QacA subfamily [Streptomyces sp. MnatMP-M77]